MTCSTLPYQFPHTCGQISYKCVYFLLCMGVDMGCRFVAAESMSFLVFGDRDSTVDLSSGLECAVLFVFQESAHSYCGLLIDISRCE